MCYYRRLFLFFIAPSCVEIKTHIINMICKVMSLSINSLVAIDE